MAKIPGTAVASPIVPADDRLTTPTHSAQYGKGGLRRVATIAALDDIALARREYGMLVFVDAVQSYYQCGPSPALDFGAAPFVPGPSTSTIYASTAAGLAAVGEGEYFYVATSSALVLYRDLSGVATEIGEFPTLATLSAQVAAASSSADDAADSAAAALVSENAAAASETAASASETAADASATLAQEWAENPEDDPVLPGQFSALHHAIKASDSREQAIAAAEASGVTDFADTHADAVTLASGLGNDAIVMVFVDETQNDLRTIYAVNSGSLVGPKVTIDSDGLRTDLASAADGKGADLVANAVRKFENIAAMTAATGLVDGQRLSATSYYGTADVPDGGGGDFVYRATSTAAVDSFSVFPATGMGGVGKIHRIFDGTYRVAQAGAKGDGVTNATAAAQTVINYAVANRVQLPGMVVGFSAPEVIFETGARYLIDGNIFIGTGIKLTANRTIITSGAFPYPAVNPLFIGIAADCVFDGFVTFGYTDVFQIATGNVDSAMIQIKNCEIQEWTGIAVNVDNNSASTLLRVYDNKFYARTADSIILKNGCDVCLFDDNWVQGPCDTFFWNTKALYIRGMLGVPGASTPGSRWVLNQGTSLVCIESRFGGEAGARTIVDQFTGPGGTNATKLIIDNCEVFSTDFPVIRFNDIPDVFSFTRNYGLTGARTFQFNAIPNSTKNELGSRNSWTVENNQFPVIGGLRSSSDDQVANNKVVAVQNARAGLGSKSFLTSDIVRNILHTEVGFGSTGSIGAGMSTSVGTDLFGAAVQLVNGVDGDSQFNASWATLMTGLPAGSYTMLANVAVTLGASVMFTMNAGNNVRVENLGIGEYTLALPFFFDGTNAPNCGYSVKNISTGTQFAHGGLRIVFGTVDSYSQWNSESYGDTAPVTGFHRAVDRVIQRVPTVGQPKAFVCTVAGTPGTWVSEGNL